MFFGPRRWLARLRVLVKVKLETSVRPTFREGNLMGSDIKIVKVGEHARKTLSVDPLARPETSA